MLVANGILALVTLAAAPVAVRGEPAAPCGAAPVQPAAYDEDDLLASRLEYYSLALDDWGTTAGSAYAGDDGQTVGYATAGDADNPFDDSPFEDGPFRWPPTDSPAVGPVPQAPGSVEPTPTLPTPGHALPSPLVEPGPPSPIAAPSSPSDPFAASIAEPEEPAPVARSETSPPNTELNSASPSDAFAAPIVATPGAAPFSDQQSWPDSVEDYFGDVPESDGGWGAGASQWMPTRERWPFDVEGFISQGVTINTDSPADRSNYPVTFNDRSNDYQMNQLYLVLSRGIDNGGRWGLGGRVDLLYGTDHRFTLSRGLETRSDFSTKWNSGQYGVALPQAYLEVYAPWGNGLTMKLGHFYTLIGYETIPAAENFFYSRSYAFQYAEPATHTGLLGSTQLGDLTFQAGMTRGWDNWEDNNNDFAFLGGISWDSQDERTSIALAIHIGRERDEPPQCTDVRTVYSLVIQQQLSCRLHYVAQFDQGFERDAAPHGGNADWFGLNQYLYYAINECWQAAVRYEWFRDEDGMRIDPNTGADYFALSLGLNWTPTDWITVRPELRWDTSDSLSDARLERGHDDDQILLGMDVIMRL